MFCGRQGPESSVHPAQIPRARLLLLHPAAHDAAGRRLRARLRQGAARPDRGRTVSRCSEDTGRESGLVDSHLSVDQRRTASASRSVLASPAKADVLVPEGWLVTRRQWIVPPALYPDARLRPRSDSRQPRLHDACPPDAQSNVIPLGDLENAQSLCRAHSRRRRARASTCRARFAASTSAARLRAPRR